MLADRTLRALAWGALLCGGAAFAAEEDVPDLEFLEYLGMWEESDEDWLILDERMTVDNEKRIDPVPEGEASTEKDDES
ncbi:MAG: hypothetical protein KJP16_03605 [Gammaproteobacteria bacterium]|nr:hypothetical protein [Gammaproteobacteria bacterium]